MSLINDALKRASQVEKARARQNRPGPALQPVPGGGPSRSRANWWMGLGVALLLAGAAGLLWRGWLYPPKAASPVPAVQATARQANNPAVVPTPTAPVVSVGKSGTQPSPAPPAASVQPPVERVAQAPSQTVAVAIAPRPVQPQPLPSQPKGEPQQPAAVVQPSPATLATASPPAVAVTQPAPSPVTTSGPAVAASLPAEVKTVAPPPVETTVVSQPPPSPAPPAPAVEFPPLTLQGIFYRAKNPSALINGRTLFVGDQIGEVKVVAIEQRSVKVELRGVIKVLWL